MGFGSPGFTVTCWRLQRRKPLGNDRDPSSPSQRGRGAGAGDSQIPAALSQGPFAETHIPLPETQTHRESGPPHLSRTQGQQWERGRPRPHVCVRGSAERTEQNGFLQTLGAAPKTSLCPRPRRGRLSQAGSPHWKNQKVPSDFDLNSSGFIPFHCFLGSVT